MGKHIGIAKIVLLLAGIMVLGMVAAACGGDDEKAVIRFYDGQWETLWEHNAIAMYIAEQGYGYPVEEVEATAATMQLALPLGELDVNMELWRQNITGWYTEQTASGAVVDLAGTGDNVAKGGKGQSLETSLQGIYVPTYVVEENPGLKSVLDLPDYKHLFIDPEDSSKGLVVNCIIGWGCQKVVRAKWHAYGLYDSFNIIEPGSAGAIDANIIGAYTAGEPVVSYYWEPTQLIADLDMTLLEEPEWNQECQDAITAATEEEPYESELGCAFPASDVHTGVASSLMERAPEVADFLGNVFLGALPLGELATWKNDNNAEWRDAAVHWLKTNESTWTSWVTSDAAENLKEALAEES